MRRWTSFLSGRKQHWCRRSLHHDADIETNLRNWMQSSDGKRIIKSILNVTPESATKTANVRDYAEMVFDSEKTVLQLPQRHLLSQLLTFPLTLSNSIHHVFPSMDETFLFDDFRVSIIGARAESSLPLHWWRHALFMQSFARKLSLRFIGPGLGVNPSIVRNQAEWSWQNKLGPRSIAMKSDIKKDSIVLHEHSEVETLLRDTHLFVLFNPGMGSKALKEYWKPTVELLLTSRKPVLCTALNEEDLRTDIDALKQIASSRSDDEDLGESFEMICRPQTNPFASSLVKLDEDKRAIATNHSYYIFQSK